MMPLFWVLLLAMLPTLALSSGPDDCKIQEIDSSQYVSPVLESLQCHNDYKSYVQCKWKQHINTPLELWFKTGESRKLCVPYDATNLANCRYETNVFSIGIIHTAFFRENKTLSTCSSASHKPLRLLQHLRTLPPVNLSTHDAADGGRKLIWSSPYPPSSSLNNNLTYQLSYKMHRQSSWTTVDVTNTSMTLERQLLLPGNRYEARVRAWASMGQWSDWSPVVTWQTNEDFGQLPTLYCVLDGEEAVTCSWEVSRELANTITYQLACQHNENAPFEACCLKQAVSSDLSETMLRYSCSMPVTDPEHLLLKLLPMHNAKIFKAHEHIHLNPPRNVNVMEKDNNWIVKWDEPNKHEEFSLYYQVCYYKKQDQGSSVLLDVSDGSMSLTIIGKSLDPLQDYQVKVRSLVASGSGSEYKGIPSEWTDPEEWTSKEALIVWSSTTLIYIVVSALVAVVFLTLYCTIPACRRKVILWVDSVPSPRKSKTLSEFMSPNNGTLIQREKVYVCKVQQLDILSTCSSEALLWPAKDTEKKCLDQDEGCWNCDNLPSPTEEVNVSDTSAMSFTGPYILCQSTETPPQSMNAKNEEKDMETPSDDSASPSRGNFTLYGEGYVCLPRSNISRSSQDLLFHTDDNTSSHWHDSAEQDRQCNDTTLWPVKSDIIPGSSEASAVDKLPEYTSGPFTNWPEEATIQASGYCHLPTAFMRAA
ncbi:cytokine receptor common subunit beta [Archocentrus centrarchus]|uniref:cytokine receptor common subunit beta n=1 Tax=Archocentrus centrarchus TaxID=63155 RepID=UPI0011EA22BC|nr:interleukin-4 receptor subunit alpha [Archocentrus centrarchus]XP_030591899.1 interleukin-4 receptor subunit alpha [Archocentrus centrarchus]